MSVLFAPLAFSPLALTALALTWEVEEEVMGEGGRNERWR
jgi:hypothetical protein